MYVYLEKSDTAATLATWLYCGVWHLYTAEKLGMTGYINWPQAPNRCLVDLIDPAAFASQPNMYEWYFDQPHVTGVPPRDLTWEWEHCPELGVHSLVSQPLEILRAYYQKNLRFNSTVNARGQELVRKYGLDFTNTMAITWRGTDSVTDGRPRLPIELYFPFMDDILAQEPGLRIFATAEENGILEPLLKRYPQAFTIDEFYASPLGCSKNPERFSPFSGYERGMQPTLMMWVMSKCKYLIKNRSSVGSVASWLSDGHIVCLAHPENLGHGFDITKAEIKGKLVPLNR
jgi:hypothetical protein